MSPTRLSADHWRWLCVGIGVVLRIIPWARNPPLWQDEAALVLNVIHLDFADYFGPLIHHQAAPPLFLAMERVALLTLGDSEAALRFPVLLLGCLSLVLFALLARRVLDPVPAAVAVGLFAVSDRLIWHATEVKPYAVDVLVAVLVAWGFVRTRHWSVAAQCGLWAVVLPVLVWLSYPTCFVAGGLLLGLLPGAIRSTWNGRLMYAVAGMATAASFAALALGPAQAQRDAAISDYWVAQLADWRHPQHVPVWAAGATFEVDRYALMPLGQLLLPLALVGTVRLARTDGPLLTVLLAPAGLTLLAALARRYPYGGGRVDVFLAPGYILLVAAGLRPVWSWLWQRARPAVVVLVGLLLVPVGQVEFRTAVPWQRPDFREAVAFVLESGQPGDAVSGDHWELLYYTRHHAQRYLPLAEIAIQRPARVWVLTGTDPGVAEAVLSQVPSEWHQVDARTFPGTIAMLLERQPARP
jgi:hypothetical protein